MRIGKWSIIGVFPLVALVSCGHSTAPPSPISQLGATPGGAATAPASVKAINKPSRAASAAEAQPAGALYRADHAFAAYAAAHPDMTVSDLEKTLQATAPADRALSFDPTRVRYFDLVDKRLRLTAEEKSIFRKQGVVGIDHKAHYSMAGAYYAIYTQDLPVLVTADSILHALHRSYDEILKELEVALFTTAMKHVLGATALALAAEAPAYKGGRLRECVKDVDIYLTVALNLFEGGGANGAPAKLAYPSKLGNDAKVEEQLGNIASLAPHATMLHGARVDVDYSQFKPRGHYTESEELKRYFRAMMWLGRADLGFMLARPEATNLASEDADRGLRDAALLTLLLDTAGARKRLGAVTWAVDFLVGRADNLRVDQMAAGLAASRIERPDQLTDDRALGVLRASLAGSGDQQIRSQILASTGETKETPMPQMFQLFGQRFLIDSFVLSKVVFDSITYKGAKQERQMPSGRDVMAALGNDEALRLQKPDLERYNYSTNLFAARKVIDGYPAEEWTRSVYGLWLDALRTLDDVPSSGQFPEVMRREAWRRKHLETQLASWAELRHDTILYGKQSYSTILCEYPEGFVEPYPEFFARLRKLANDTALGLQNMDVSYGGKSEEQAARLRDAYVAFFRSFGETMQYLELLAQKELAAKPFSPEEVGFLKKTIEAQGGGCGPPDYDGWYTRLIYGGDPLRYKPSVADVHSSPQDGQVLEEGVGDVDFLIVAIDNQKDRAVYVGPAYSYYEFTAPMTDRMTDEAWKALIEDGNLPPRPSWTSVFRGKPKLRMLEAPDHEVKESDPRVIEIQRSVEKRRKETKGNMEASELYRESQLMQATKHPPLPKPTEGKK